MRNNTPSFGFLIILLLSLSLNAQAQQQPQEGSLLPDIDPQDIEIRGNFTARFLGLNRQPILGFNPTPRVYQIDPDRSPFMESPDQILANLPVSELSRPKPPSISVMTFPQKRNLYSSLGFGRFSSPEGELYGNYKLNSKSGFWLDGSFESSEGHFDTPVTSYRFFNGTVGYVMRPAENRSLRVTAGGLSDFNHTFNIGNNAFLPVTPEKEYTGFNAGVSYQTLKNSFTGWQLDAKINVFNTDLLARQFSGENDELTFSGAIERQWAGKNLNEVFAAYINGIFGNYETLSGRDDNWSTVSGGLSYRRTLSFNTTVDIAANVYFADNEIEGSDFYILPDITLSHWLSEKLKASIMAKGNVFALSNQEHHQTNRFLNTALDIKHTRTLEGTARIDYELQKGTVVKGGISYLDAKDYAHYLRTGLQGNSGFFEAFYGDVNFVSGFVGFTHYLVPERFWIDVEATLQNRELDSSDFPQLDEVPFMENLRSKASLSYDTGKKFSARLWANLSSSRFSPQTQNDLDGFFLLGLRTDFAITDGIGIYAKTENLLNQEYQIWRGYEERPVQFYGGITITL